MEVTNEGEDEYPVGPVEKWINDMFERSLRSLNVIVGLFGAWFTHLILVSMNQPVVLEVGGKDPFAGFGNGCLIFLMLFGIGVAVWATFWFGTKRWFDNPFADNTTVQSG
jgi:hypothetical protein